MKKQSYGGIYHFVKKSEVVYTKLMTLPVEFLRFWFVDSPKNLIAFFVSLNNAFFQLFSLPLLIKTYFKPWKNEYRKGLVGFSIGMGMFIKTWVILADITLLILLLLLEFLFTLSFFLWPVLTVFIYQQPFLFFLSIAWILGIFFIFKPKKSWINSVFGKSTLKIVKELLSRNDVLFVLQKTEIVKSEIQLIDISRDELFKNAFGKTSLDVFAAYLFLTEEKTKLLFNKKLKQEDLRNIIDWAKAIFPQTSKPFRINFRGEGIGESWTSGWTLETGKYMDDITSYAVNKKPMILGREKECKEVVEAMSKSKSCLLVGDPGSGRGSFVNALAYESFAGNLKGTLNHQRFFQLITDSLLAGAGNQGELEERLKNIIAEISHAGNIIVYIPNFENITGASTFNTDLSGALIPYLQKGQIRIVANITKTSYKRFIEPKLTLASVFETVKFDEPAPETSFQMLLQKSSEIEENPPAGGKITISYKAIAAVFNFANKYFPNRVMPGSGVALLEDTVSAVIISGKKIIEEQDVIDKVEEKTKIAVGDPRGEEKKLLINLEEELGRQIVGQKEAVFEVSEALRRFRTGLSNTKKPTSFLFMGPTGVGKTATAKVLASTYYKGENNMIRFDMSEYSTEDSVKRFLGGIPDSKGLTDMISDNPYSLVLLDEFEKSNPKIVDLFLQVLDDGRLTDNSGKTVSFTDAIIIATSNAGSEFIREEVAKGTAVDKSFQKKLLEVLQEKEIFRPELLNRFDGIIVFKPLIQEDVLQIVKLMLDQLSKKLLERDIVLIFDEKIASKVTKEGFDQQFGARPLKRFIQDNIEDLIAQKILKDEVKRGNKVNIFVDSSNNLQVAVEG